MLGGSVRLSVPLVVLALLAGAACGGGSKADDTVGAAGGSTEGTTSTTAADGTAADGGKATEGAGGGDTGLKASGGASATTVPTTPPTTDPENPLTRPGPKGQLALEVTLAADCVRPGATQTITMKTEPGSGVGFDTVYADGKGGMMEGHHGGNFGGMVDGTGTWTHTWPVAPTAPAGRAQVNVLGSHMDWGTTQKTLFFTVADATGNCS